MNMKKKDSRKIDPKEGVYARPHASAVSRRKKERRWVKDGSGRCHVFLVSIRNISVSFVSLQSQAEVHVRFYHNDCQHVVRTSCGSHMTLT